MTDSAPQPAPGTGPAIPTGVLLFAVTFLGLVVRAIPVFAADFPVNDGGLFVTMTRAITSAGWLLPATVAWNGSDLPFVYPPAAFYLGGFLETVLGMDLLVLYRWFPLVTSAAVVPAVFLLGRDLLRSTPGGLSAAVAYGLAPSAWVWLIQGGGATRAPGLLLAVLAIWQFLHLVRDPNRRRLLAVGVLAGLTALVHPGAAVFTAVSGGLLWIFEGRSRASLAAAAGSSAVAFLVVLPWLAVVVSRAGLATLLDVPSNGPDPAAAMLALLAGRMTGLPFTDPLAVLALAVAIVQVARRRFLLPLWLVVSLALSYQYAMVPFGILVGVAVADLITARRRASTASRSSGRLTAVIGVVLGLSFVVVAVGSMAVVLDPGTPVHAVSAERREAMGWLADRQSGRVAVITDSVWNSDADSEWFPLLTTSVSVATVQGSELLGQSVFRARVEAHAALQACVRPPSVSCVQAWVAEHPAELLYLPKGRLHGPSSPQDCCADLRNALYADARSEDPAFAVVYDGAGGTIFSDADLVRPPAADDGS